MVRGVRALIYEFWGLTIQSIANLVLSLQEVEGGLGVRVTQVQNPALLPVAEGLGASY